MTQPTVDIRTRPPLAQEIPAVAALLRRVFTWAYGGAIPAAPLTSFLASSFANPAIAADFVRPEVTYQVAECRGTIVGVARLELGPPPGFSELQDAIELAKCYVLPEFHGQGVAAALLNDAIGTAQAAGRQQIWLCVWEENPRAVAFYQKHGFAVIGTTDVWVGDVRFVDLLMLRSH